MAKQPVSRKRMLGCIIALFFGISNILAQPVDSLLALLPENNNGLKALQLEYQAALQLAPQVAQLSDPDLKLGWYTLSPETRVGPQKLWLIFNQKLPWPGKLSAQKELALAKAQPLLEELAGRRLILEQQLKKAWLKGYQLSKQQEIIEEHLNVYERWEQVALSRLENNKSTAVEVYRIQLQKRALEQRNTQLEIEKTKPQATINGLLGRVANATIEMPGFLGIPDLPVNLEDLLSRIGTNHPMIRVYELRQAIAKQALTVNRLDEKMDFTVGMDYFLVGKRSDANPAGNGRDILMPHLAVQIPLNKGKYRAKQQEEVLKIQALDQRSIDQLSRFNTMVEQALAEYRRAENDLEFIDEQVNLLRTMLRIAQSDYANNKRSFTELLQLQDQIVAYQERHLTAVLDMHLALTDLQFYLLF